MTDRPLRVVVVHGEPIAAAGLRAVLAQQPALCVDESPPHDREAVEATVIVTDYDDGIRRLQHHRDRPDGCAAPPRVVIVTSRGREQEIRHALAQGAFGFLAHDCDARELVEAVRSAARGARFLSRSIAAIMAEGLANAATSLTRRELEVLHLVAGGLCNKLIGNALDIAPTTAKSHVRAILDKLGACSRTQAAAIASRRGLLPAVPDVVMPRRGVGVRPPSPSRARPEGAGALQ